jgi:hypothetical protein
MESYSRFSPSVTTAVDRTHPTSVVDVVCLFVSSSDTNLLLSSSSSFPPFLRPSVYRQVQRTTNVAVGLCWCSNAFACWCRAVVVAPPLGNEKRGCYYSYSSRQAAVKHAIPAGTTPSIPLRCFFCLFFENENGQGRR